MDYLEYEAPDGRVIHEQIFKKKRQFYFEKSVFLLKFLVKKKIF